MPATIVFNAVSISPGQSVTAIFPTPGTWRGIQIMMIQIMANVCPFGCKATYQLSIDGGVIFSDPIAGRATVGLAFERRT